MKMNRIVRNIQPAFLAFALFGASAANAQSSPVERDAPQTRPVSIQNPTQGPVSGAIGGGPLQQNVAECVTPQERASAEAHIAAYNLFRGTFNNRPLPALSLPVPYPFHPQAGTLFDDIFINNYVDLDPSTGILDWDGTNWTYDGHAGHDATIHSFGEQFIGVPIFAALDGTVVDAHDGEFDMNTSAQGLPANYAILQHEGTHQSWYWHMKKGSVAVTVGQQVKAGQQLGLTASSGNSTGPHLHFESHFNNQVYEPYAGVARPGPSNWTHQTPVRRDMYIEDFNFTNVDISKYPGLPYDMPRTGTFQTGTPLIRFWMILHNQPAGSAYRLRWMRPNGTVSYDTGANSFNNTTAYRAAWWWFGYYVTLDTPGTWNMELSVSGTVLATMPFTVVSSYPQNPNRAPLPVTGGFDPVAPTNNDVIFCRLAVPLYHDPDYDLVSYHYQWVVNGIPARDVTTAGRADPIPAALTHPYDVVQCRITPYDGKVYGATTTLQTTVASSANVTISGKVLLAQSVNLAQPIVFTLRPPNNAASFTRTLTLNADGSFLLTAIPNGAYRIAIKGAKWLQKVVAVDATNGPVSNVSVTLEGGDASNDNSVDATDFGILVSAYNSSSAVPGSGYDIRADFNCDGSVDATDFGILVGTYNQIGDL